MLIGVTGDSQYSLRKSHIDIMLLAALWNAVDHAFPNTRIIGCNFHFRQCLWRRIQAEGTKCQHPLSETIDIERVANNQMSKHPHSCIAKYLS